MDGERRREALSMAATIIAAAVIGSIAWLVLALGPGREAIYRLVGAGADLLLVTAVALSAAGFGLQLTLSEILRAAGRIGAASFSGGALYGLAFAIALACIAVGAGGAGLDQVLVIQASIMACAVAACLPLVAKALGGFPRDVAWRRLPRLVWESLPGGLLYPAFNLLVQMDLLALSYFRPAEVAVYGAANRLVLLLTVPGVVLEAALAQPYARHLHAGNRAMLQSLVSEAAIDRHLRRHPDRGRLCFRRWLADGASVRSRVCCLRPISCDPLVRLSCRQPLSGPACCCSFSVAGSVWPWPFSAAA